MPIADVTTTAIPAPTPTPVPDSGSAEPTGRGVEVVFESLFGVAARRVAVRLCVLWAALSAVTATAGTVGVRVSGWCADGGHPLVQAATTRFGVHATGLAVGSAVFVAGAVVVTATGQVLAVRAAARALAREFRSAGRR